MRIEKFSPKQMQIMHQVVSDSNYLICDGAVRSGKTIVMTMSFVIWAMENFNKTNFGICGKTVANAERNIIKPFQTLEGLPYEITYKIMSRCMVVKLGKKENYFYCFGGKDESSYALVQGITLAGALLDEVALMPKSFVEQVMARTLTFSNAKVWFNCNPESPSHWFYQEWILQAEKKEAKHLHFLMQDNPIITESERKRAEMMYTGVFYERYILGLWTQAEGLIYPMHQEAIKEPPIDLARGGAEEYCLSLDYGTQNPFACLVWGKYQGVWYAYDGYYYNGRAKGIQKTDEDYGNDLDELVKRSVPVGRVKTIVDPSAASFIALLRKKPWCKTQKANNDVLDGIRETATAMQGGLIKISPKLKTWKDEASSYVWDDKADDKPVKENDHYMDATRYFVKTKRVSIKKRTL